MHGGIITSQLVPSQLCLSPDGGTAGVANQMSESTIDLDYDVCFSFAGEQRSYVEQVAELLRASGVRVFYDDYEKAHLWGKDLYTHLDDVYRHQARYCILFASEAYAKKVWTNHERRSAQARAIQENREYVLPARFDDAPIPGLPETIHYVDLRSLKPEQLAELVREKIGERPKTNYLPPVLDRLFLRLDIEEDDEGARHAAESQAWSFMKVLKRMSPTEREVIFRSLLHGCTAELPNNVHIDTDLLRRCTEIPVDKLKRILGGLQSLGFSCSVIESHDQDEQKKGSLGHSEIFEVDWIDLSDEGDYPALLVAVEMVQGAVQDYCEEHGIEALRRLDFSQLAAATTVKDMH